jgi:site-specific recombinase XerD
MMRLDAHEYGKAIERLFIRMEKSQIFAEEDITLLKKYRDYLSSEGITLGRVNKYLSDLKKALELLGKRFPEAGEEDIRRIVLTFERNDKYSPWSKRDFKVALRKFYTWLRGTKDYPPEVAWLKVYAKIRNAKTHEDMLTEEEVKRLIEFAWTPQERAFIAVLYESGCRIGELIYLRINQVRFDEYGAQLFVTGKTGFRRVRVVACVPYLTEWINKHPFKGDPKAYLWLNRKLEPFRYNGIAQTLYRITKRAGINKKVNPHNFRHSRATYLANFLTEAQMKEHFGWTQDSKMAAVYVYLSGRDVDKALLKVYGITNSEEKKESIFKPKECSRCQQVNQATNRFCSRCGIALDKEAEAEIVRKSTERTEADRVLDGLLQDDEFREMFVRKIGTVRNMLR